MTLNWCTPPEPSTWKMHNVAIKLPNRNHRRLYGNARRQFNQASSSDYCKSPPYRRTPPYAGGSPRNSDWSLWKKLSTSDQRSHWVYIPMYWYELIAAKSEPSQSFQEEAIAQLFQPLPTRRKEVDRKPKLGVESWKEVSNKTVERFHARTCIQQSNMPTLRRGKGNCIGVTWPGRHHCGVFFSFLTTMGMGKDVRYNDTREANELATGSKLLTLIRFLWRWCI